MEPFPFIVGMARSGTTLLRAIVDANPEIAIPPESRFIADGARHRDRYETANGWHEEAFVADLRDHQLFERWGVREAEVQRALAAAPDPTFEDAVRAMFSFWAQREEKPRSGDKSPHYLQEMPLLAALFPEARFVHIIRDVRDVTHSLADRFAASIPVTARRWRIRVTKARSDGRTLGSRRYREIRYEDLLDDPERIVQDLCGFLDLTFDDAMLRHHERADHLLRGLLDRHVHERLALPLTPGLRDWRSDMDPGDVGMCEQLAGDLLTDLGYELSGARPSLRARSQLARYDMAARGRRVRGLLPGSG